MELVPCASATLPSAIEKSPTAADWRPMASAVLPCATATVPMAVAEFASACEPTPIAIAPPLLVPPLLLAFDWSPIAIPLVPALAFVPILTFAVLTAT